MTLELALYILIVVLNGFDAYTTYRIVTSGGLEANPFLAPVMKKLGTIPGLLAVKIPLLILVYIFCMEYAVVLGIVAAIFLGVVIWNFRVIKQNNL